MTENPNPLVSVIMPVYNCAEYVDEAIESMVNQTYTNMEILIIDDCSTDGTIQKIENWTKVDKRITLILKEKNSGYVESINMAIEIANGKYIARMDGDDICVQDRIEKQVNFLEKNLEVAVLGTAYFQIGSNRRFQPETCPLKIKLGLLLQNQIAHPTVMFRKRIFNEIPRFYISSFIPMEDFEFWNYLKHNYLFSNLSEPLLYYRIHEKNISRSSNFDYDVQKKKIIKSNFSRLDENISDHAIDLIFDNILNYKNVNINNEDFIFFINYSYFLISKNKKKLIYNPILFSEFINLVSINIIKKLGWKKTMFNNWYNLRRLLIINKLLYLKKFKTIKNLFIWQYNDNI